VPETKNSEKETKIGIAQKVPGEKQVASLNGRLAHYFALLGVLGYVWAI